ncbi:MAG: translocation/assembly module TamB domain-containing protein [Spirochaetia bacterium]
MKKAFAYASVALVAISLIVLTALAAWELDRLFTERMAELKGRTIAALEEMLGRRISYAAISPSIFQYIEVRDLTIYGAERPDDAVLTIHTIRVSYSLAQLLAHRDPLRALHEIRILNTRLALDLDRDQDLLSLIRRLADGTGGGQQDIKVRLSGANVSLSVTQGGTTWSLQNLFFQVDARDQAIHVALRGAVGGRLENGFSFSSIMKVEGSVDRSLSASDLTVHLLTLESSLVNAGSQTLQVLWKQGTLDIRKIQDRSPIVLQLTAELEKQQYTLKFQTEDMRLSRLFSLVGPLARYENWMKTPLTASGHITYSASSGSLDYQIDAAAYFEDQLPVREVSLETSLRGTEKQVFFSPLRVTSPSGSVDFEGSLVFDSLYPEGLLTLMNVDAGTGERVNARLSLERVQGRLEVLGDRLEVGELTFNTFKFSLSPLAGGAAFSLMASFAGPPQADSLMANGELHFDRPSGSTRAAGTPFRAPNISLTASLKNAPPDKLYHLLVGGGALKQEQRDLYDLLGRLSVNADLSVTTDLSTITVASREVTISQWDDPGTSIRFGFLADNEHIALNGFSGTWKGFSLEGAFDGRFAPEGEIAFTTGLKFLGTPYDLNGRYSPREGLQLHGSYGLSVSASTPRDGRVSLRAQAVNFPLPISGHLYPVSFQIQGTGSPQGGWVIDFPSISARNLSFLGSRENMIALSGRLTPSRLDIRQLTFSDAFSRLDGSASADFQLPEDVFDPQMLKSLSAKINASLKASGGEEAYSAQGSLKNGALALNLQLTGSPLSRLGSSAIKGSVSGTGAISGTMSQPVVDIAFALKDGRVGNDNLSFSGLATLSHGAVQARALRVDYLSHHLSDGAGSVELKTGSYTFSAHYKGEYLADPIRLNADLSGQVLPGRADSVRAGMMDQGLQGRLSLSSIVVGETVIPSWSIAFRMDQGKVTVDGGPGNSIHGWIDAQRSFYLSLANPLPIIAALRGRVVGDHITSTVDVASLDMTMLNQILKSPLIATSAGPQPILRVTSGVATGRLTIDGPLGDPDYTGQLEIIGGGVSTAYSPDNAGPIRTTLTFEGKSFHSNTVIAGAGSAKLSAEARFTIDHWAPLAFDITLATVGTDPLHLRAKFGRLNTDGLATGQLRIAGDDRKTNLTGNFFVSDCKITLGPDEPGKFVPEEVPTFVTLGVQTGKRVEFYWPSENLPVVRTTATPGGSLAITYRGDTGAYTVKGGAGVQGGEIYYFDRSFVMKKGSITFDENQDSFDPHITTRAEVREWDPNTGEDVKVYLDADSTLSKFSPRFSSDPARTSATLLSMIGAPIVNRAESQGLGMAALVYSDIVTQGLIIRPFEQKVRQMLNLDMFSVRTQILQNLVAQKVFGTAVNPLDNTSVSLGKYIGNDLFLELLVRLQSPQLVTGTPLVSGSLPYEDLNTGATIPPGSLTLFGAGLQPDLELSMEWATPLFLLTWSWVPQHPESMFLSDNSLAFSWRIAY